MPLLPGQTSHYYSITLRHDCVTICLNNWLPTLSIYRQAAMISLAHLSSWSAERIASATLKMCPDDYGRVIGKECDTMCAGRVWDLYMSWRRQLPIHATQTEDIEESMWRVIRELKFDTTGQMTKGRGLAGTPRPTSFPYAKLWFPSERYSHTVLPSYVPEDGIDNYQTCVRLGERGALTCFTPAEHVVITKFGPHVLPMMRKVLIESMEFFELDMMRGGFSRKIYNLPRHLNDIMRLANRSIELWCQTFGSIESHDGSRNVIFKNYGECGDDHAEGRATWEREHLSESRCLVSERNRGQSLTQIKSLIVKRKGKCLVHLNSTPEVIKMFVICMITDRIHALDELRLKRRRATGLTSIAIKDLPSTARDCSICREPLSVPNENGKTEYPAQLVCCCGQYVGERCLKAWYRDFRGNSCPLCRREPPISFFAKLFEEDEPRL